MAVFVYLVVIPAAAKRSPTFSRNVGRLLPIESRVFGALLMVNGVLYAASAVVGTNATGRDAPTEVAELGCALIMAAVALDAWRRGRALVSAADRPTPPRLDDGGGTLAV